MKKNYQVKNWLISKSTYLLIMMFVITSVFAQAPQKMSYQAIVRNSTNQLVTNTTIGMRISIIQSTPDAVPVYTETQTPTTNENGLVTIEFGGGAGFSDINWGSGPSNYIKSEIDPAGGTNYTITATTQLLTVPYAFYTKTAERITGSHYVGELYGGGVVAWVDHTGAHGLIISMVDISSSSTEWSDVVTGIGAAAQSDWNGLGNSEAIVAQSGHTNSAAKLCLDYTNADYGTGVYSDWYLPAISELNDIWTNLKAIQKALDTDGNPATTPLRYNKKYWSSTEYISGTNAYIYSFETSQVSNIAKSSPYYVRAVRAF